MNPFEVLFNVRDYECDIQGIVNNAVYQNYLEHTRHEYLKHLGLEFKTLHDQGFDLVVIRAELDYRFPLRSGDAFKVTLSPHQESKVRMTFQQNILRLPDLKPCVQAKITVTCLNKKGRPTRFPESLNPVFES
jgi:acyl-CoA thioester hydrolase